jgi:phage terminase large subunit
VINKKYLVLDSDSRYYIVTGGRGSGKSYAVSTLLCLLTQQVGHVILFTRYTLRSAGVSIIPEFLEKIEFLGMQDVFHVTKDEIINKQSGRS